MLANNTKSMTRSKILFFVLTAIFIARADSIAQPAADEPMAVQAQANVIGLNPLDPGLDMTPYLMPNDGTIRRRLQSSRHHSNAVRMRNGHFLSVSYNLVAGAAGAVHEIVIRSVMDTTIGRRFGSLYNWQHDPAGGNGIFGLLHPVYPALDLWASDMVNGAIFLSPGTPSWGMNHILRRHLRDPHYPDLTQGQPGWHAGTPFPWTEADSLLAIWSAVDAATLHGWWFYQSGIAGQTRSIAEVKVTLVGISRIIKVVTYWNAAAGRWYVLTAYPR